MSRYFGVIGNRDYIKYQGEKRPFWEFLDSQPDGWLTSLAYRREDLPTGKRMIFDCGAWSYRDLEVPKLGGQEVTAAWAFEQYSAKAQPGDLLIAPDHMLIPGVDLQARRDFNIKAAHEFLKLAQDSPFVPMATVHGDSLQERIVAARWYAEIGYPALALGGLAARASQKSLILDMVWQLRSAAPKVWMHVLGLSSPIYAAAWKEYGIDSFDGSSHFKQAFTAGTFFSLNQAGTMVKHQAARPGESITAPACDCRACALLRGDGIDTRQYGNNETNMGRAAHNMNVLMRAQKHAMHGTTVLVSCVGEKLPHAAPAADLYQSDWFKKARAYAEQQGGAWYILSALHGLLPPDKVIDPYESTLNGASVEWRKIWAAKAFDGIRRSIPGGRLVILAGRRYRDDLVPMLLNAGYAVDVPMEGLGIGQQLAWLMQQTTKQLQLF